MIVECLEDVLFTILSWPEDRQDTQRPVRSGGETERKPFQGRVAWSVAHWGIGVFNVCVLNVTRTELFCFCCPSDSPGHRGEIYYYQARDNSRSFSVLFCEFLKTWMFLNSSIQKNNL